MVSCGRSLFGESGRADGQAQDAAEGARACVRACFENSWRVERAVFCWLSPPAQSEHHGLCVARDQEIVGLLKLVMSSTRTTSRTKCSMASPSCLYILHTAALDIAPQYAAYACADSCSRLPSRGVLLKTSYVTYALLLAACVVDHLSFGPPALVVAGYVDAAQACGGRVGGLLMCPTRLSLSGVPWA